jgi:ketosteroid isomerase-like protein
MNTLKFSLILIVVLSACNGSRADKSHSMDYGLKPDSTFFKSLVSRYTESVDKADTALAAKLWSQVDDISFINPMGHEHGWDEIKNIYSFFKNNFSERKLSVYNLKISVDNNFAWLEFYWVFDAVTTIDNRKVQTKGRETQIWKKTDNDWHLIHVHYSDMPATVQAQGL